VRGIEILNFRGRYDAFLRPVLVFGSEWCILVEAVLYALHKKCQQKLCTTSKGKGGFWRSARVTEFGRGISPTGRTGSRFPALPPNKGLFVHFMLPLWTAGQEKRRVWRRGAERRKTQPTLRWTVSSCRQSVDSLNRQNGNFRKSSHFGID